VTNLDLRHALSEDLYRHQCVFGEEVPSGISRMRQPAEGTPFKSAVVQIGYGKFVAKLFVKVLENTTISGLHGSEILG
jgi:hypothetical protein